MCKKEEEDMAEPIPKFYHKSSYFQRQIWAKHKIHMCNVSTITEIHNKFSLTIREKIGFTFQFRTKLLAIQLAFIS